MSLLPLTATMTTILPFSILVESSTPTAVHLMSPTATSPRWSKSIFSSRTAFFPIRDSTLLLMTLPRIHFRVKGRRANSNAIETTKKTMNSIRQEMLGIKLAIRATRAPPANQMETRSAPMASTMRAMTNTTSLMAHIYASISTPPSYSRRGCWPWDPKTSSS